MTGVGSRVHVRFAELGFDFTPTCNCRELMEQMDREGPAWCRANMGNILNVMLHEARGRQYVGRLAALFPGTTKLAIRKIVTEAIEEVEREQGT
jgi:hypothetical protein